MVPATAGQTYHLRARVRDQAGHVTPWTTSTVVVPYDDRAFTATGVWTARSGQSGRFAGTLRESKTAGAALSLRAYGSSFALVADRCSSCGKVNIYVDGKLRTMINLYAASTQTRRQVWSTSFASIGQHTVKVVVDRARRHTVRIDGLIATR